MTDVNKTLVFDDATMILVRDNVNQKIYRKVLGGTMTLDEYSFDDINSVKVHYLKKSRLRNQAQLFINEKYLGKISGSFEECKAVDFFFDGIIKVRHTHSLFLIGSYAFIMFVGLLFLAGAKNIIPVEFISGQILILLCIVATVLGLYHYS